MDRMKTWDDVYPEYQHLSAIDKQCFIEKALNNASKDEINVPPNLKDANVYKEGKSHFHHVN